MKNNTTFKQTEVGVIPSDWEVKKVGECLLRNPDYGINAAAVPYNENLPIYLRITDITEDGNYSKKNLVSVNNISSSSYFLQEGDLVFARTGASVGKTYLYNPKDGKLVFAGFLIRVRANEEVLLSNYLKYFTQTKRYWDWIASNSMRTGQPGINGNEYKEIQIPLPPTLAEQTAIAIALNDADALIQKLEQLIAKKRNIKTGVMQELLRPKEGWEEKTIQELVSDKEGIKIGPFGSALKKELLAPNGYKVYGQENVFERSMEPGSRYIAKEHFNKLKTCELKSGDFIVSMMGTIGKCMIVPDKFEVGIMDSHLIRLRLRKEMIDINYLLHYSSSSRLQNQVNVFSVGGIMAGLSSRIIKQISIPLPKKLEEQTRIAQILSDMDNEIQELEKQLDKYKMLKQGMMQSLLTGKIRLV